jgi:hypothetical protein
LRWDSVKDESDKNRLLNKKIKRRIIIKNYGYNTPTPIYSKQPK